MKPSSSIAFALLFFLSATLHAAEPASQPASGVYPIDRHGALQLKLPSGWKEKVHGAPGLPPTIEIHPGDPKQFLVQITALPARKPDPEFNSPARLRNLPRQPETECLIRPKKHRSHLRSSKATKSPATTTRSRTKRPPPA